MGRSKHEFHSTLGRNTKGEEDETRVSFDFGSKYEGQGGRNTSFIRLWVKIRRARRTKHEFHSNWNRNTEGGEDKTRVTFDFGLKYEGQGGRNTSCSRLWLEFRREGRMKHEFRANLG